ncbi:SAM-dependent methyltransferase RsmB/NOP2-type [Trypanosoma melophagium]|uniref:SAM-dependent methyltransferase RsmB/NOP2-type n=1 Tax=Trypanosoma melophagium TaxID=715481 RepID=UPI00351AA186|nr:SAM-dependent methyltransferase RsmB/NOP2-type [Trypanosoma melophagium]
MAADDVVLLRDYPDTFTEEFIHYCRANHLPPQLFHDLAEFVSTMPRYVCVLPHDACGSIPPTTMTISSDVNCVTAELTELLGLCAGSVHPVPWLPRPHFFSLPRCTSVGVPAPASPRLSLLSMDAASAAAVVALRPLRGEVVWDACCAPGAKLGLLAAAVGAGGAAVGSDGGAARLTIARSLLRRREAANVLLLAADGRRLTAADAVRAAQGDSGRRRQNGMTAGEERELQRWSKRQREKGEKEEEEIKVMLAFASDEARRRVEKMGNTKEGRGGGGYAGFDRVLVDAECSHDGSLAHMCLNDASKTPYKAEGEAPKGKSGIDNLYRMKRLNLALQGNANSNISIGGGLPPLVSLQLELIKNGYTQLKPGGTMVYCTCSFSYQQNEFVVREMIRLVNASDEIKQYYGGEAVLCHPFEYVHETAPQDLVSPIVNLTEEQATFLRQQLETAGDPYGIIAAGKATDNSPGNSGSNNIIGVRFWPQTFATSFQFISKIWKKPLQPSGSE